MYHYSLYGFTNSILNPYGIIEKLVETDLETINDSEMKSTQIASMLKFTSSKV